MIGITVFSHRMIIFYALKHFSAYDHFIYRSSFSDMQWRSHDLKLLCTPLTCMSPEGASGDEHKRGALFTSPKKILIFRTFVCAF